MMAYLKFWVLPALVMEREQSNFMLARMSVENNVDRVIERVKFFLTTAQIFKWDDVFSGRGEYHSSTSFIRLFSGDPVIGGISLIDENDDVWGVGKFKERQWVRVVPSNKATISGRLQDFRSSVRIELDEKGVEINDGRQEIPSPRLASPWFRVFANESEKIFWTMPYTSSVIGEPVISAAIKLPRRGVKGVAAHVRLTDFSLAISQSDIIQNGAALLIDKQSRLVTLPFNGTGLGQNIENVNASALLHPIQEISTGVFNLLFDEWLKAGRPLKTSMEFSTKNGEVFAGSVSSLFLGETELFLLLVVPKQEFNLGKISLYEDWLNFAGGIILLLVGLWGWKGRHH